MREARDYTLQFEQELITLYQNMKHHMEQVVQQETIQDVLECVNTHVRPYIGSRGSE